MVFQIISLVAATLGTPAATAATDNGWSSEPAWAATESPPARKPSSLRKREYNSVPFAPGSSNLAIDVGQVFLMGDLSDNYNDSIGGRLHYTYGVSDIFGFDSSFGYSSHSDGKMSMTTLLTGLRTNLAWYDKVVPYVVFGLGFYKPSMDYVVDGRLTSVSPVVFGLHLGPGVHLEVTDQLFFGASLTFHDIFGTNKLLSDGRVVDIGGTYTSFFLHAGVSF
jgi:hypothetical protein